VTATARGPLWPHRFGENQVELKRCGCCHLWLPLDVYTKDKKQLDGLKNRCRSCRNVEAEKTRIKKRGGRPKRVARKIYHRFGVDGIELKRCAACHGWLPLDYFPKWQSAWDDLSCYCKKCYAEIYAKRREGKDYKQQMSAGSRRYYENNKDAHAARCKSWADRNPDRANARFKRYKARKKGAKGSHTLDEWTALCESVGGLCLRCGSDGPLDEDHVVPLSKGGSDDISNIQPLCHSCNAWKIDKLGLDFRVPAGEA